ncbi:methyltransferase domain-containing protein [Micromonospora sp. DT4]|uniref:methyltransferase domain-containing protein n=1 Tax=Micromonospora sp. DT4 TaxID=3393438 RepID=UPI003CF15E04
MGHNRLRHRLVDSDQSWSARQRRRRSEWLTRTFPDIGDMHVVDLGGRLGTWHRATVRPARVTVVNLEPPPVAVPEWAHVEQADACDLPAHVTKGSYDLVFSNSVLEHVGGHEAAIHQVLWTELLDRSQMRHYFPDSTMLVERVVGLPKSLIAVRTGA